jgi:hypothetical protein
MWAMQTGEKGLRISVGQAFPASLDREIFARKPAMGFFTISEYAV